MVEEEAGLLEGEEFVGVAAEDAGEVVGEDAAEVEGLDAGFVEAGFVFFLDPAGFVAGKEGPAGLEGDADGGEVLGVFEGEDVSGQEGAFGDGDFVDEKAVAAVLEGGVEGKVVSMISMKPTADWKNAPAPA